MDGRILPEPFQTAYEQLWARTYSDGGVGAGVGSHPLDGARGVVGKADGKVENAGWRVNSGQADAVGQISGPKQKTVGKTARTLRDERAFQFKQKVDKELRRIAAKIRRWEENGGREVGTEHAGQRVCAGRCKRFGDVEWSYCCWCGGPMREVEKNE
jgi:hypothetical protein